VCQVSRKIRFDSLRRSEALAMVSSDRVQAHKYRRVIPA